MKVDNDFGVNILPLERGSCAAKFRLLLRRQQQQRHIDSTTLRFEILTGAANFAVTAKKIFFSLFFNFYCLKHSFTCTSREKNIFTALSIFFNMLLQKSGNLGQNQ